MKLDKNFEATVVIASDKLGELTSALGIEKPNSKAELNAKKDSEKIVIAHIENTVSFSAKWDYISTGYGVRFVSEQNKKMSYPLTHYTISIHPDHSDKKMDEIEKKLPLEFAVENADQNIKVQFSKKSYDEIELKISLSGKKLIAGELE